MQLVVDTNVWAHGDDPRSDYQGDSIGFQSRLLANSAVIIALDPNWSLIPNQNRSQIMHEYHDVLQPTSLAYHTLASLAANQRILAVPRKVKNGNKSLVEQKVRNKTDRIFVFVALNCTDRLLISHDFIDFQQPKRDFLRRKIGLKIDICRCHP